MKQKLPVHNETVGVTNLPILTCSQQMRKNHVFNMWPMNIPAILSRYELITCPDIKDTLMLCNIALCHTFNSSCRVTVALQESSVQV